jgi:hypothetical protein
MVYRPTVRYPDMYKSFVDDVFKVTRLDRNQIIRLALFVAAHSEEFKNIVGKYKFDDVPLPHPEWGLDEEECWKNQNYIKNKKEIKNPPQESGRIKIVEQGGITFVVT